MAKTAVVILAQGFEEIEAVAPIDILRRLNIVVTVAGLDGVAVASVRRLSLLADIALTDVDFLPDAVILPGGMPGAENLGASPVARDLTGRVFHNGGVVAAICAAPAYTLSQWGILKGRKATGFPGTEEMFPRDATFTNDPVVIDGNVVTSRGAGTANEFALAVGALLVGEKAAIACRERMLIGPR